jgi:hypothetical protein
MFTKTPHIIAVRRDEVLTSYKASEATNRRLCLEETERYKKCIHSTTEYTFDNQKFDAVHIVDKFYHSAIHEECPTIRAISIIKLTKVGMDGLMIELAKSMTTHPVDDFVIPPDNVLFITGMSNIAWERDFQKKMPGVFRANIHHHGKLQQIRAKLQNIRDAVIIIDEIDCGDKEYQKMHKLLRDSGVLDMKYMDDNNIRFVFVSATIATQLRDLYNWGDRHDCYKMTVPDTYIGHREFMRRGIIQEYYPVKDDQSALRWGQEDIIDRYGDEYRVHFIRTDEKNKGYIERACHELGITCFNHTSDDRINVEDMTTIFKQDYGKHVVVMVKGLLRRAELIPNAWKERIGAMHERYSKTHNTSVAVQGFPGRMSGYWKSAIDAGHKTGPYRTSIAAMNEYLAFYDNPTEKNPYTCPPAKSFVHVRNIKNLEAVHAPVATNDQRMTEIKEFASIKDAQDYYKTFVKPRLGGIGPVGSKDYKLGEDGWYRFTLRKNDRKVWSCEEIRHEKKIGMGGPNRRFRLYPCYEDVNDQTTLKFLLKYWIN